MRYFDAVVSSLPDFYFPLQGTTTNYGKYEDEIIKAWTPAEITTSLWLDADDSDSIIFTDGKISQWSDKSGNSNHATQDIVSLRPVINEKALNNRNTVAFNDTPLKIDKTSWSDYITIFSVARATTTTTANAFIFDISTGINYPSSYGIRYDAYINFHRIGVSSDGTGSFASISRGGNTDFFQQIGWYDGSTISLIVDDMSSPATSTAESGPILYNGATESTVGGYLHNSSSYSLIGDIAELIILPYAATDDERFRIQWYLHKKWNTKISPNNTYASSIVDDASITYNSFPISSSSLNSFSLNQGGLSYGKLLDKLPYKLWKKQLAFECLFVPGTESVSLLKTSDTYYDDQRGELLTNQSVIDISFDDGCYTASILGSEFKSEPITHEMLHHCVIYLNGGNIVIYNNGAVVLSASYSTEDLYEYVLDDIITEGDGNISDIGIYLSVNSIDEIVGHYYTIMNNVNKDLALNYLSSDLSYNFSYDRFNQYVMFESPVLASSEVDWKFKNSKNVLVLKESNDVAVNSQVRLNILDENFTLESQALKLSSGISISNLGYFAGQNFKIITHLTISSDSNQDKRVLFHILSGSGEIIIYLDTSIKISFNNYDLDSLIDTEFNPTKDVEYSFELSFGPDSFSIVANLESSSTEVINETTTDSAFELSEIQFFAFSMSDNSHPLVGTLDRFYVTDGEIVYSELNLANNSLDFVSSAKLEFNSGINGDYTVKSLYSPINSSVKIYKSATEIDYGATVDVSETDLFEARLNGSSNILQPRLYKNIFVAYTDKTISAYDDIDRVEIEGDFIGPVYNNAGLFYRSPYEIFKLNEGALSLKENKLNVNYIQDWSFSNLSNWTLQNCVGEIYYSRSLTGSHGILFSYTSQAPEVRSKKINVLPSTDYSMNLELSSPYKNIDITVRTEWYDSSNNLLSQNDTVTVTTDSTISDAYIAATSPSNAKYCRVKISAASQTGATLLNSLYFGREFNNDYESNNSGFSCISAVVETHENSINLFSHNYDKHYFVNITTSGANKTFSFGGFDALYVNNTSVTNNQTISNIGGWMHICAVINNDSGILRPSLEQPLYVGRPYNNASVGANMSIDFLKLSLERRAEDYNELLGTANEQTINRTETNTISLDNDRVIATNDAWITIR